MSDDPLWEGGGSKEDEMWISRCFTQLTHDLNDELGCSMEKEGRKKSRMGFGLANGGVGVPFIDWGWEWEVGTCFILNVCPHPHPHSYVETYSPV